MGKRLDFEELITPLTAEDIGACIESGRPKFEVGAAKKLCGVFNRKRFDQACLLADDLQVAYASEGRMSMTPLRHIDASDVDALYQTGGTLCITGINQTCADLRYLSTTCKMSLGWSGVVDCAPTYQVQIR